MNKVLLVGRMTNEPEKRSTSSGISYIRFTVAINRPYSKEQTDFIPIVAWRQSADFVSNYIHKGYLVSIEGYFTSSRYTNDLDQLVTKYEITVDRIQNLEPRRTENRNNIKTEVVPGLANIKFESDTENNEKKNTIKENKDNNDVPWDIEF